MLFNSVIGQEGIRNQLISSARESRVSHALLFHGPPGCGKLPLALAFAQYLNCSDPGPNDSCGVCPSCRKAEKFIHPDIHFVFPVVKEKSGQKEVISDHYIDKWRSYLEAFPYPGLQSWLKFIKVENKQAQIFKAEAESILQKLHLKSFESDIKIVLIWLPEKMNITAANKLLKIIEEPPEKTIFLMVAQSTEEIIPTILSRTQLIRINKLPEETLSSYLKNKFPERGDVIDDVSRLADGNYLAALDLIDSDEQNKIYHEIFVKWFRLVYIFKVPELLEMMPQMAELGREKQKEFFVYCLHMIKENFHSNLGVKEIVRMSPAEMDFSKKFHKFINPGNIEDLHKLFSEAIIQIGLNANPRIIFLDMSTRIYQLLRKGTEK